MNIFVLDQDPVAAAQQQCDKHVVKMIVETAQLLSTAHRMIDGWVEHRLSKTGRKQRYWAHPNDDLEATLYKACHHNHPSAVWCRESVNNYNWLYVHFVALCKEYTHRYGKVHATETKLSHLLQMPPHNIATSTMTPFKLAMGSNPECIDINDPVGSYRNYYWTKRDRFTMAWTNRAAPDWWVAMEDENIYNTMKESISA